METIFHFLLTYHLENLNSSNFICYSFQRHRAPPRCLCVFQVPVWWQWWTWWRMSACMELIFQWALVKLNIYLKWFKKIKVVIILNYFINWIFALFVFNMTEFWWCSLKCFSGIFPGSCCSPAHSSHGLVILDL